MTTTTAVAIPSTTTPRSKLVRTGIWVLAAGWIAVAFVHPNMSPETVGELRPVLGRWMGVHIAQLVLAVGLAYTLWHVLRDNTTRAARLVRGLMPVYLVFFAAFDSVVGLAAGLAVDCGTAGEAAARHIINSPLAGDFSVITNIASVSLITVIVATGLALKKAGAPTFTWALMLTGVLLSAHSGAAAAVGVTAIAWSADRVLRQHDATP
jgi:hypothetical protein